jgi:hypothetical protein
MKCGLSPILIVIAIHNPAADSVMQKRLQRILNLQPCFKNDQQIEEMDWQSLMHVLQKK